MTDASIVQLKPELEAIAAGNGQPETAAKPRQGSRIQLREFEPWPEPVRPRELVGQVADALSRHVVMSPEATAAVALYVLFCHVYNSSRICPLLVLTSPVMRCGKTTLLGVISRLVPRPLPGSNITPATLFRVVEAAKPTLLVDEADSFLGQREELRGILNSGHTREAAFVLRVVGEGTNAEVRQFGTWGPKVICAIGKLHGTIADRSIVLSLERKRDGENVEPLLHDDDRYAELGRRLVRWAQDSPAAAGNRVGALPGLNDRAVDNWRPLLSIADTIGGPWSAMARAAALTLSGDNAIDDESIPTLLLSDLKGLFAERDRLPTAEILASLTAMEDRPWADWRHKGLSAQALARLLRPFGIRPRTIRLSDGSTPKGFHEEQFLDAWSRYLPVSPSVSATPPQPAIQQGLGGAQIRHTAAAVADRGSGANPLHDCDVAGVADAQPQDTRGAATAASSPEAS